jgi:hypothetical protein
MQLNYLAYLSENSYINKIKFLEKTSDEGFFSFEGQKIQVMNAVF